MTKDELPGLFSKIVKFVRKPMTDWSNLPEPERDAAYSKQQLKEMLERKQRNDVLRHQEFDQLRKLRSCAGPVVQHLAERSSFFNSSLSSRAPDQRVGTLKKIDEIEEQMSQQWWSASEAKLSPAAATTADARAAYAVTEAVELSPRAAPFDTIVLPLAPNPATSTTHSNPSLGQTGHIGKMAMVQDPAAQAAPVFVHLPALEEASIRFASGDFLWAETLLQNLLTHSPEQPVWQALFDFYRATVQPEKFEATALAYAGDRLPPPWQASSKYVPSDHFAADQIWFCPAQWGPQSHAALLVYLARTEAPWHIDWSALRTIEEAELTKLTALFTKWHATPEQLRFIGSATLLALLSEKTPSGVASVHPAWWHLRLAVLHATGQFDAHDLAALGYCVTYETPAPVWHGVNAPHPADAPPPSITSLPKLAPPAHITLSGHVSGEANDALAALAACPHEAELVVACGPLVRVDFSAAGAILNWAAVRQAAGGHTTFCDLHHLVAVFFNVVGMDAHAAVVPRED